MNQLGHFTLVLGFFLSVYGFIAGFVAGKKNSTSWFLSARNATLLATFSFLISTGCLGYLFYVSDFSNEFVWKFSNREMPTVYKVSAIWGGMDGSMLFWLLLLSINSAFVAWKAPYQNKNLMPWVISVMNSSVIFFATVTLFLTNPFRYIKADFIPPDGNGLNPLLQNPYMAIHPPMLYLGFTTLAIPFAFCMAELLARTGTNEWIRLTRTWTLIGWMFLSIGIVLGGHWAYLELGWGGFWAWDPVENSSFLPWLVATAFLHSVMVQERKNMLKFWNVWLIVITYSLTVFGTFLTRSGIVQSVHAFASTDIGWVFLLYLAIILFSASVLTFKAKGYIVSEKKIESLLSREAAFLVNNLIFLSICFSVLWGVMFPVFSEAITGKQQTVGIPFFNAVTIPMFLLMLFLMGVGPLIAWRKASLNSIKKTFLKPFIFASLLVPLLLWAGITSFYPVLSYSLCWFVALTILSEIYRGIKAQKSLTKSTSIIESASNLMRRHRSRYGGYLVHLAVVIMIVSITASMAHKFEKEFSLNQGETIEVGRFNLTLDKLSDLRSKNYDALVANTSLYVTKTGEKLQSLNPELRFYRKNNETTTEVALRMGPREDFYLVLAGIDENGTRASFKVFINPLQIWLWIGALLMACATLLIALPDVFTVKKDIKKEDINLIHI